ncbi:MAG: GDP-mannose 4,6-dehydratase [Clostridiales bacterium]|nr:GDP-mannose 4,6-dehydratase [Clostridiales bacterium]
MNILITGVNGFVGKNIVKALSSHYKSNEAKLYGTYFGIDNFKMDSYDINLMPMDITDSSRVYDIVESIVPDYVFHLAAQSSAGLSWKAPQLTFNINVNGTINLLDAIKNVNNKCRVLVIGTSDEYGSVKNNPVAEDDPVEPENPYAISKMCQEKVCQLYVKAYGMNIVMTRSFSHIGPMQEPNFVIADWAKQISEIEKGIREPVISVGNINIKREFADVRDVIKAYLLLIEKGVPGEVYNVGSGRLYSLEDILKRLLSFSNKDIQIQVDQQKIRPVESKPAQCNYDKLFNLCGWKPEFSIDESLKEIIEYWRNV